MVCNKPSKLRKASLYPVRHKLLLRYNDDVIDNDIGSIGSGDEEDDDDDKAFIQ